MNAAQVHLVVVHLPVVGCPVALILLILAQVRKDDFLFKLACGFLLACTGFSAIAYYSGPPAYELLQAKFNVEKDYVEGHAVLARAAFFSMIVLGVAVLNALLQFLQGEQPARWLKWGLLIATVGVCYLFAWSAHQGGLIRHPEIREPGIVIFPEIMDD